MKLEAIGYVLFETVMSGSISTVLVRSILLELQKYLKTKSEFKNEKSVIQRNSDVVQRSNTHVCGHLCLVVLTSLMREQLSYQEVLDALNDGYSQDHW